MTRINLVPVEELTDQHLFAEFREIKMVPKSLGRSLRASEARYMREWPGTSKASSLPGAFSKVDVWQRIPKEFTLNKGHVMFFYDKGAYLFNRYNLLRHELRRRGYGFDENALLDPDNVFAALDYNFNNDYSPTPEALALVRARIAERIARRPGWYRYMGVLQK